MKPDPAADQALIRASFDTAPDGVVVIDAQGRHVAMNSRYLALWQFPADMLARRQLDEMRAHVAARLCNPDTFHQGNARLRQLQGTSVLDEIELLDGRSFERHVSTLDDAGHPGAMVVRWREVTARRAAQRQTEEARSRLSAVFTQAREAILLADDQGRYIDANPGAEDLLGRSRDQLLQLSVADVLGAASGPFEARWREFLASGHGRGEVVLRRPDGSERIAHYNAVAHIQPGVHLSILSDDTEGVLARRRQLETATQMELAMVNARMLFWGVDLVSGELTLADPGWTRRMLGYEPHEIDNRLDTLDPLVHPQDLERREAAWQAHVEGRTPTFECEFRIRHRRGHWMWLLARGRAIERDASGRAKRVVGVRIDITRQKQAEQELEARAFTDGLTGLLNRRRFIELAELEVSRALRHHHPVSVLMIDLDHFKSVNDLHGHAGGDTVLMAFADTARAVVRGSDLVGRVGGEEFAMVLPETDMAGAVALADRLRGLIHQRPAALASGPVTYTVSVGVASHPDPRSPERTTVEALMLAADNALYRAKADGRDRVLAASGL